MYYHSFQIVLQEVPGEISLCFSISGCRIHCEGCHSPFLWKEGNGKLMHKKEYEQLLNKYSDMATCVLFMGGEWHEKELVSYLKIAQSKKFKTCLYTGEESISDQLKSELTWLKTGRWEQQLGGLDSPQTNQKFIEIRNHTILNHLFHKN